MKRPLLTLIALLGFTMAFAQSGNVKDVRQTYLWDVTLSMQGKAPGCPNIWEPVKEALIADIQQISDDRTEIVVIPFQHIALDEWREPATAAGKANLIAKIKGYKIPLHNFNGHMTTMTCLYEPLKYVVDKVLSPDKVDILKLMTDGVPDEHEKEYEQLLASWCEIAKAKDAYGFYIMLTSQAAEGKAVLEKINPCRFGVVDVSDMENTSVSTVLLTAQLSIAFNVREDYGQPLTLKYAHNGTGSIQPGYKVHIYTYENSYIQVDEVVELTESYTVTVKAQYLMKQDEMIRTLPRDENEKVFLRSEPADGMDQYPFAMTQLLETPTVVEMINKPEKTVKFHVL